MPLHCAVYPEQALVLVAGEGRVTRCDIKGCLSLFKGQPFDRYGKLFNLLRAHLALGPDDVDTIGQNLRRYCSKPLPGPIALAVKSSLNLDMAVLVKQRVPGGKFRVFSDQGSAYRWLRQATETGEWMRKAS